MVLSTIMALESLTEQEDSSSDTSCCNDEDLQVMERPMKGTTSISVMNAHNRKPRRTSWKFNTDWEGAISSFRSATSSILSASLNSWYHVLEFEEDEHSDDELDASEVTEKHGVQRAHKPFKRSLHSTLLDEERTSFQSSLGNDQSEDMNEYLESLNRSKSASERSAFPSTHNEQEDSDAQAQQDAGKKDTAMLRRLSGLLNMKCDMPDLLLLKCTMLEKDEADLVQERVRSLQELDDELNEGPNKATTA